MWHEFFSVNMDKNENVFQSVIRKIIITYLETAFNDILCYTHILFFTFIFSVTTTKTFNISIYIMYCLQFNLKTILQIKSIKSFPESIRKFTYVVFMLYYTVQCYVQTQYFFVIFISLSLNVYECLFFCLCCIYIYYMCMFVGTWCIRTNIRNFFFFGSLCIFNLK